MNERLLIEKLKFISIALNALNTTRECLCFPLFYHHKLFTVNDFIIYHKIEEKKNGCVKFREIYIYGRDLLPLYLIFFRSYRIIGMIIIIINEYV